MELLILVKYNLKPKIKDKDLRFTKNKFSLLLDLNFYIYFQNIKELFTNCKQLFIY